MAEHRQRGTPRRPWATALAVLILAAVVAATIWGLWLFITAPYAPPAPIPARAAERIYLAELDEAGLELNDHSERLAAIEIARQHIAHGHLVGMREWIRQDFRDRIPDLTEEQIDVARVVLEHHFQRVTGRTQ